MSLYNTSDLNYEDLFGILRAADEIEVFDFLNAKYFLISGKTIDEKIQILRTCIEITENSENERVHCKDYRFDYVKIFRDKCSIELADDDIRKIFRSVEGIVLDGKSQTYSGPAQKSYYYLSALNASHEDIVRYLYLIFSETNPVNANKLASRNDKEALYVFEQVKRLFSKNGIGCILETLAQLICNSEYNDIEIENRFVYFQFVSNIKSNCHEDIYVIEPTPLFVKQWMEDYYLKRNIEDKKIHFVFQNDEYVKIYKKIFTDSYGRASKSVQVHSLEEISFIESANSIKILLFSSHIVQKYLVAELMDKAISQNRSDLKVMIFDSDETLRSNKSVIFPYLIKSCRMHAYLLPAGIINSTMPQRKMLINCEYNPQSTETLPIQLSFLSLIERDEGDVAGKTLQIISRKMHTMLISDNEFNDCTVSLRNLYRESLTTSLRKTDSVRKKAYVYEFSNEIEFRYSVFIKLNRTIIRVCAYIVSKYDKSVSLENGTKKEKTIDSKDSAEKWLVNEFLGTKSIQHESLTIQEVISDKLSEHFESDAGYRLKTNISFKTFVYFFRKVKENLTEKQYLFLKSAADTELGTIPLLYFSSETIDNYIVETFENSKMKIGYETALNAFETVFSIAIENDILRKNPAENLHFKKLDIYREYDEVRNALSKQSFSTAEAKRLESHCLEMIKKGEYLYIFPILRLHTGLEANLLTVLRWEDIVSGSAYDTECKRYFSFNYLKIYSQFNTETGEQTRLERAAQVRLFPISNHLQSVLDEYRNLAFSGSSDEGLLKMPIIPTGSITIDILTKVVEPSKLNHLAKDTIKILNLKEDIVSLTESAEGKGVLDLNRITNDIYKNTFRVHFIRNNYAHHLLKGEVNYLLGIKANDVDFDHYIDCGKDRKLYQLYLHLNRLYGEK